MSCAAPQGIGQVLENCVRGCGHRAPMRRLVLADRVEASRRAIGHEVQVALRGIPSRDPQGRHAHVLSITLEGTYRVTVGDSTNDAISGLSMLAVWSDVTLTDLAGWRYFAGVDGRTLWEDVFFRHYRSVHALPGGLAADAGADDYDIDVSLTVPLTRVDHIGPTLEGAIPLASLQARGPEALTFKVGTPAGGAYTNVTNGGFQSMAVWVDVVYLPAVVIDAPWQVESYALELESGTVRHSDRLHEYLAIRYREEDAGGLLLDGTDGITVQAGNATVVPALSTSEMTARTGGIVRADMLSESGDLPLIDSNGVAQAWLVLPRSRSRKAMAAGPVSYQFSSRDRSATRWAHRTVACHSGDRARRILAAAGLPAECECVALDDHNRPAPIKGNEHQPIAAVDNRAMVMTNLQR